MVAHVVERAVEAGVAAAVLVATDDERIAAAAVAAGARPVMTTEARSGTDRVAEAVRDLPAAVVLNVQGDEPALPPENLRILADYLLANPLVPMATLALPASDEELRDPNTVKVVISLAGHALYFSRAAIPYPRNAVPGLARKHVGLYGFQKEALLRFAALEEVPLERAEGLEQLRALAHGMAIQVLEAAGESVAVDTPEDVARAEAALATLLAERSRGVTGGGPTGKPSPSGGPRSAGRKVET